MSTWAIAAICLIPPLAFTVLSCGRGTVEERFASIQLSGSLVVLLLAILSFILEQATSIDLALTLALLTLPATLLFALFLERWI